MRVVDLTIPIRDGDGRLGLEVEFATPYSFDNCGWQGSTFRMFAHYATHVDAPNHFIEGTAGIDEAPLGKLMGPAAVIDLSDHGEGAAISADTLAVRGSHTQAGDIAVVQGRLGVGEVLTVPVIRQVKEHRNATGPVIIDAAPGTSCPVVEAIRGSDVCLLVTEPTPFGRHDLELAVALCRELGVPCGVVLNRAGTKDELITDYCRREGIPILLTIPLDRDIAALYSLGVTLAEALPDWRQDFIQLYEDAQGLVHERTAHHIG